MIYLLLLILWGAVSFGAGLTMALGHIPTRSDLTRIVRRRRTPPNGRLAHRYARGGVLPPRTHGREIPTNERPDTHAGTGQLTMDGELTACGRPGPIATRPAYVTCPTCRDTLAGR